MTESKIESAFKQDVFKPCMSKFANFANYVKEIESENLSFALVSFVV